MNRSLRLLQLGYSLSRRLGVIDVTWLLHLPAPVGDDSQNPPGYTIRTVTAGQLAELRRDERVDPQVGDVRDLEKDGRVLVGAFSGPRLVAFAWFASRFVAGCDNYSRAMHLGTSIDLPDGVAFVYNAWTDPEHRGRRLMRSILSWAIAHSVGGGKSLATMIDWTNQPSRRAFEKLGMRRVGLVVRLGRGPFQISLLPRGARRVGLRVATDAPGMKFAW
jgi:hypothetical protein